MARSTSLGWTLAIVAAVTLTTTPRAHGNGADQPTFPHGLNDVTGTYLDAAVQGTCDQRATSGGSNDVPRAVTVVYWRGLLTLRVVPTQTIRALHIQTRARLADGPRADYHNGLARWEGRSLVVESALPALPLWSRPVMLPEANALVERFEFSDVSLTYHAAFHGQNGETVGVPFDLTLARCGPYEG
jgi:hypothetical protein